MNDRKPRSDRRRWPRVKLPISVQVLRDHRPLGTYMVANLSAGGALLSGGPEVAPGTEIEILLHFAGRRPVALPARVVRSAPSIAVSFHRLSPDQEDLIHDAVLSHLEFLRHEGPPSVLVVDDCDSMSVALAEELCALGHRVGTARTPLEALRRIEQVQAHLRVIIVELFLGTSDGLEVLAYVAKECPSVRRVLMSGTVRFCQLELAVRQQQAHAILVKPWNREQLVAAVAAVAAVAQ